MWGWRNGGERKCGGGRMEVRGSAGGERECAGARMEVRGSVGVRGVREGDREG